MKCFVPVLLSIFLRVDVSRGRQHLRESRQEYFLGTWSLTLQDLLWDLYGDLL